MAASISGKIRSPEHNQLQVVFAAMAAIPDTLFPYQQEFNDGIARRQRT
jgi:hypothetical protein